jgi:hypothetical protein
MHAVFLVLTVAVVAPTDTHAETPSPTGISLAAVADWSTQHPFINVMKTARPWIGHRPGSWGGQDHDDLANAGVLDANGWPTRIPPELGSIGTVILTDLPPEDRLSAGRYRLTFEGNGIVEVSGSAQNVRYGTRLITFDFAPGAGPVEIRIQRTDRARNGDHVRNITVIKDAHTHIFAKGALFNPDWITRIEGFDLLRFMDWMDTNNSIVTQWAQRPKPQDYTYARIGVPVEMLIALANQIGADAWFNMPHMADDAFIRTFAQTVRAGLAPDLKAYVEYSNEVWNWQFDQTHWADAEAQNRWNARDSGVQYYGMRAAQTALIWSEVFGADGKNRLVNVISTQTGWPGLEEAILTAPRWVAENPKQNPVPATLFDAYAVTGYFGGILGTEGRTSTVLGWITESRARAGVQGQALGLTGADLSTYMADHQFDYATQLAGAELLDGAISGDPNDTVTDLLTRTLPYHAAIAAQYNLDLIMYEGGSHVVGLGALVDDTELSAFFVHFNYSPEMGALYTALLDGWRDLGGQIFTAYSDVYTPTKWGSWGALRHLADTNPRWDALTLYRDGGQNDQ